MSAIQNFKNFIRHSKQARAVNAPPAEAVTNVSPVHAEPDRRRSPPQPHHMGISEPAPDHRKAVPTPHQGEFSAANVDNRNVAARAGGAAAKVAAENQKIQPDPRERKKEYDPAVIERIVAEERESKGKLPKYPGLERYRLIEKMGDGAFSNVYRAKDLQGEFEEVAVKVVRKFEMNASQVGAPASCRGLGVLRVSAICQLV
jgi:serine/threonine-protein kinase RCK2